MKVLCIFVLLLATFVTHAQEQPGVNCHPIQGQGWSGCAPNYEVQPQHQQAPRSSLGIWVNRWGAIATYEPGGVLGISTNMSSDAEAKQAAMADCQAKGGRENCKLQLSYVNGCAVLLVGDRFFNASAAETIDKATRLGMKVCTKNGNTNCHVYYSACSLPFLLQ